MLISDSTGQSFSFFTCVEVHLHVWTHGTQQHRSVVGLHKSADDLLLFCKITCIAFLEKKNHKPASGKDYDAGQQEFPNNHTEKRQAGRIHNIVKIKISNQMHTVYFVSDF